MLENTDLKSLLTLGIIPLKDSLAREPIVFCGKETGEHNKI